MKSTFRILFYLKKNEPKKDGTVTIMARITVDGETKQFSTKKTIHPEDWDIKSGRAVNKSGKSTSAKISKLNKELDDLRGQISIQYTKQLNNNGYVEPEKLRNNVLGIEEKQHSLLTYFTEHNLQYKDKVGTTATQKTYSRYELTKQRLIDFMKVKYRVSDILIREINAVFIENFYLYLRNEHGINNNTAMKFVQRFHSVLIYAKNSGLNFVDPFGSFKFSFDKVDRGYLNQDEIDLIYNKEFSSARLAQVRDMFIFSCYTGLSYIVGSGHLQARSVEHIQRNQAQIGGRLRHPGRSGTLHSGSQDRKVPHGNDPSHERRQNPRPLRLHRNVGHRSQRPAQVRCHPPARHSLDAQRFGAAQRSWCKKRQRDSQTLCRQQSRYYQLCRRKIPRQLQIQPASQQAVVHHPT